MAIKYVSFDLDGTLADSEFDDLIWHEEVPKLYAKKHNISLEEAKTKVYAQYYIALDVEKIKEWTDIEYWFNRLGLSNWKQVIEDMKKHIFLYEDTIGILEYLSKKYKLIIISDAHKHFFEVKLEAEGIKKYFDYVFSSISEFSIQKKNKEMFLEIIKRLKIKPNEIVHIGNDHNLDYEVPLSVGIRAYHLVRSKSIKAEHVIHSLSDLKKIL